MSYRDIRHEIALLISKINICQAMSTCLNIHTLLWIIMD